MFVSPSLAVLSSLALPSPSPSDRAWPIGVVMQHDDAGGERISVDRMS